jgi:hypothetical protein
MRGKALFPKGNKFNAKKIRDCDGKIVADSKAERDFLIHYFAIKEEAGLVKHICKWPTVHLTEYINWKLDYKYFDCKIDQWIYTDVKGVEGERFRVLKALWKTIGPSILEIAKKDYKTGLWKIERIRPGVK